MLYGYARVSTRGQINGNSLEEQRQKLQEEGCEIIVEEQYTGTTTSRPEFDELLKKLQPGDRLVVTKMDRFARSASEGSTLIQELQGRGIGVHILNMGLLDSSSTGKLVTNVLLAFAQFERDMICERTQAGKEIARKKSGFREGRPSISKERKAAAVRLILKERHSYNDVAKETGLSRSTIIRAVREARLMD
ncbi:MAG: recombinase family protein [Oribacterium sp.]|nr:recombinase family protein [Oribacterium sp.]